MARIAHRNTGRGVWGVSSPELVVLEVPLAREVLRLECVANQAVEINNVEEPFVRNLPQQAVEV